VTYSKIEDPSGADLFSHSQTPFLMDPKGNPIAILPADSPQTEDNEGRPELVAETLATWVR